MNFGRRAPDTPRPTQSPKIRIRAAGETTRRWPGNATCRRSTSTGELFLHQCRGSKCRQEAARSIVRNTASIAWRARPCRAQNYPRRSAVRSAPGRQSLSLSPALGGLFPLFCSYTLRCSSRRLVAGRICAKAMDSRKSSNHRTIADGGVGERLNPAVLKTVRPERVSGVRIPPPPPVSVNPLPAGLSCSAEFSGAAFTSCGKSVFVCHSESRKGPG